MIDPAIAEHRGRIVKTTGDGLLVEFASVVDALRCANEVQGQMAERNAAAPGDNRIEFRIGINVGDIVASSRTGHGRWANSSYTEERLMTGHGASGRFASSSVS